MRRVFLFLCTIIALLSSALSHAQDCWMISNIKGYSAFGEENYKFSPDALSNPMLVCFTSDGGTVSGTDTPLLKFGMSTLAGYSRNDFGHELFEIYQLDRNKKRLLYTKSRVGTATGPSVLPNVAAAFIGDAVRATQ